MLKPSRRWCAEEPYSEEGSLSILTDIISLLSSWPEYAETILGHEKGQEVIERVTELVQEKYLCAIMERAHDADLKDAMYRFAFLFYGGWGVFRKWCLDGLKDSPEYLFQHLKKLL